MQDFNHISSIWKSQSHAEKLISAEEMLSSIQSQVQMHKQKHRFTITILVIVALILFLINVGLSFQPLTHLALAIFNLAVITAIYQFIQLKKQLKKSDYAKDNQSFITDYMVHQQQKIKLYERYYWVYTFFITIGLVLSMFELSQMYSLFTTFILSAVFLIWMVFCSLIIRKLTIKKAQKEVEEWVEKYERFRTQNEQDLNGLGE